MAFGKPSVTFTIEGSGVNYVSLNGETGIEVKNGDAEAYAQAIRTLASDSGMRAAMGEAARRRAEALFTYEIFAENIAALFGSL